MTSREMFPFAGGAFQHAVAPLPPALQRSFPVIAFDWDGAAVPDRRAGATPVRDCVEQLLCEDVWVAVISGASLADLTAQFTEGLCGTHVRRLMLCTNRGSEVYTLSTAGRPELQWRRTATRAEDRHLTAIAEQVRDDLTARTGLPVGIVADRLNRRKIDLMPLAEWSDPPKAARPELLVAVQARLRDAGLPGGLRDAFALAERAARACGLPGARITTDVKHIEIGLTDKGDAIAWVMQEIAKPGGSAATDLLIVGDEFGAPAGVPGSDSRMLIPATNGAVVVSVGPEPEGVPAGIIHLGGGPPRFLALLDDQVRRRRLGAA